VQNTRGIKIPLTIGKLIMSAWTYRLIRGSFAGLFIYSGVVKLLNPKSFAVIIEAFGIIPENLIGAVALGLPLIEVMAGVSLGLDLRGALTATTGLIILFMVILGYGMWMGLDIDCGCFGPGDPEAEAYSGLRSALYRDLLMMGGIFYLYFWRFKRSIPAVA
jgi:hypothetical protein